MNFGQAISKCLSNYARFSGRASRSEFWWFTLFQILVSFVGAMLGDTLAALVGLAILLPAFAVSSRRLHDIGKSGWWQLLMLTGVGILLLIYWWVLPTSEDGDVYDSD